MILEFETETYPKLWHLAYDAGCLAKRNGFGNKCNLTDIHCFNGKPLRVYESAWQQGYNGDEIPIEFKNVETYLANLPTIKYENH